MADRGLIYLDTHAAIWLRDGDTAWLSKDARREVERCEVRISPMVVLELQYLYEVRRLKVTPDEVLQGLTPLRFRLCETPWMDVVRTAMAEAWSRDPFDRMIVANARARDGWLLTRDERIHRHYRAALT